jgi:hypothetical protein
VKADNIRQFATFQLYDMFGGHQVVLGFIDPSKDVPA